MATRKPRNVMLLAYTLVTVATTKATLTAGNSAVNVSFGSIPAFYTFEDVMQGLNVSVISFEGEDDAVLLFETTDRRVFQIVNETSVFMTLSSSDAYPQNLTLVIEGIALGIANLDVKIAHEDSKESMLVGSLPVKVNIKPKAIMAVAKYLMLVCVIIGFVNMGGTIDLSCVWEKLRRPWAVLIGIVCQFLIMPPLAFGLAKALRLDSSSAIGLVLDGSCPGGYLSNLISIMIDVDYVLSLTMTFCSNILAMGMMPLNLFIYTPPLIEGNTQLETPFGEIGVQLVLMFIPISIGIFFRYKSPRIHRLCTKLLKPLSAVLIVLFLATSLPFQLYIFASPLSCYIAAFLLPLCGGLLGFGIAKMACLPLRSMTTIALETGVQNALLAMTIITFFYPHPEAELASRTPALIMIMTLLEGVLLIIIYTVLKNFVWKTGDDEKAIVGDDGDEEERTKGGHIDRMENGDVREDGKTDKESAFMQEINANDIVVVEANFGVENCRECQTDFDDDTFYTNKGFQQE